MFFLTKAKGFPDVNTRMMIRLLWCSLQIPILALVDADPHGEFIVQAGLEKMLNSISFGQVALSFFLPRATSCPS